MKKILCAFVLIMLTFCACEKKTTDEIKNTQNVADKNYSIVVKNSLSESDDDIATSPSALWWDSSSEKDEKLKDAELTEFINGTEYTFKYYETYMPVYGRTKIDEYIDESDRHIYVQDGKTVGFHDASNEFCIRQADLPQQENPQEYTLEIAKQTAGEYINIDDYTIKPVYTRTIGYLNRESKTEKYEAEVYVYVFSKQIAGIDTLDRVSVSVTEKGEVMTLHVSNIGALDSFEYDEQNVKEKIMKSIDEFISDNEIKDYTIENQIITYSPENKIVASTDIKFNRSVIKIITALEDNSEDIIKRVDTL